MILIVMLLLLVVWVGFVIIGLTIKALAWLAIVGLVLFVITAIGGAAHHLTRRP